MSCHKLLVSWDFLHMCLLSYRGLQEMMINIVDKYSAVFLGQSSGSCFFIQGSTYQSVYLFGPILSFSCHI